MQLRVGKEGSRSSGSKAALGVVLTEFYSKSSAEFGGWGKVCKKGLFVCFETWPPFVAQAALRLASLFLSLLNTGLTGIYCKAQFISALILLVLGTESRPPMPLSLCVLPLSYTLGLFVLFKVCLWLLCQERLDGAKCRTESP